MSKQLKSGINMNRGADIIIPCSLFFLCVLLSFTSLWTVPDRSFYDTMLKVKCAVSPVELTPRIVSVDLTDSAERNLGDAVGSRRAFLDVLRVMKRAGVTGCFDFLFAESKDAETDRLLAETAEHTPGCVFAAVPLSKEETGFSGFPPDAAEIEILKKNLWYPCVVHAGSVPSAAAFLLPYRNLASQAPGLAHAGLLPDPDGVERRVPLLYRWGGGYLPSLPLLLAVQALGVDTARVVLDAGRELVLPLKNGKQINIPIDGRGCMYIPYAGLWKNGLPRIPLDRFVAAAHDDAVYNSLFDTIDGNVLCISDLTTAKKDFGITPLEPVYPLSGIHTAVLNAILTETFFRSCSLWIQLITVMFLSCGILFAMLQKKSGKFHGICIGLLLIFTGDTAVLWFVFRIVPWYCGLFFAIIVFWISSWLFRVAVSYRERMLMEHALSRYFPHSLAVRVLKEGRTDLAPAKKELTMLFSDISGFTHWSSDKTPETVHAFLSEYLSTMAKIIFDHGGTVDKFIGDGILTFFGDPFDQSDHTARAVSAAIDMQKAIRVLALKWQPIAGIDLKVRIGINTGEVIVGNLGSDVRIDYTVIGAAVNLASRMESNAPLGGILIAENAYVKVKDLFTFSGPQPITAKGYDGQVQAYVVME